jgi:lipoprotein-anchoring transpeptidase ErfK/SrfK
MTTLAHSLRLAATLGLASLGGASNLAAQPGSDDAQVIVDEADAAIRAIDPTTGGQSLVVDPSLPQPYGSEDEQDPVTPPVAAPVQADAAQKSAQDVAETVLPERTPAVRQISQPVAQALPVAPAAPRVQSDDPFTLKSILTIPEGPFRYGDWYWDESNAPAKGKLVVTVDLDARVISAFRDGHEIGTAVALLGTKKHPTPLGTFPILTKEKDNISEKYNNAPMPWTLRLTWDGIAIHGSPVINGYASHGCIGVPDEFAEKLFAVAKRGDKVVITRGEMIEVGDKLG